MGGNYGKRSHTFVHPFQSAFYDALMLFKALAFYVATNEGAIMPICESFNGLRGYDVLLRLHFVSKSFDKRG